MTTMPFGKFKGLDIETIPGSYLAFVADECKNVDPSLIAAVRRELATRYGFQIVTVKTEPAISRTYLVDWIRRASVEAHPDTGGSVGMMKLVNELRERL